MKEKNYSCDDIVCQLVQQVRNGNQEAFGELLRIYEPLFRSLLSKQDIGEVNEQDLEDVRQELTVVFYHSILSYELGQSEVRFGLYAKICMTNALITQLRKIRKREQSVSLSSEEEKSFLEGLSNGEDPAEAIANRETLETLNRKIRRELSPYELSVWQMYLTGNSTGKIATSLGKSEKSIENAIFRIRRKLRNLFATEEK